MDQVSDIVALPHLDDSGEQEGVLDAKRKRDDTVSILQEFDAIQIFIAGSKSMLEYSLFLTQNYFVIEVAIFKAIIGSFILSII